VGMCVGMCVRVCASLCVCVCVSVCVNSCACLYTHTNIITFVHIRSNTCKITCKVMHVNR